MHAQAPPPDGAWRTFTTDHFRVTFSPDLEPLARKAGAVAERAYAVLRDELAEAPSGTIDLVVTDHVDYTNGYANYYPSNRMVVFARPPTAMPQLAYSRDWLELVVVHELAHIFHLDESGGLGNAVRTLFGQVPSVWPIFPVAGTPSWSVEGLATYYESRLTGVGRIRGSFHRMIVRTAAIEGGIPDLDELSAPHPAWPAGQRAYAYGSHLMHYIAERYGPDAHRTILEATGSSVRPTFILFDHVAEDAVGRPFDAVYDDWRREAADSARDLAHHLAADGLTPLRHVAGEGPYAGAPRVSPDGRLLSFASDDFRSGPVTRVTDLTTGRTRTVARRNQFGALLGPAAWLPGGSAMIVAQLERQGPFRVYSDLWRLGLDGDERRLTHGLRLAQPDVAPDGHRVAATRSHAGRIDLVVHDLETGETRTVLESDPGDALDTPRWSPDGSRIAVARFAAGRVDIVVVDPRTGATHQLTDDAALDLTPAWSPDGRWILWWSDRTGIPNILAARADGMGPVRQATNVLTGVFEPEISPDGTTFYVSAYHQDGWRIEATPFDPSGWPEAPPGPAGHPEGLLPPPGPKDAVVGSAASGYSPWPTVRPWFWVPEWESSERSGGSLHFAGLSTRGHDLLARHRWQLSAAVDVVTGRVQGAAAWSYHRLAPLELTASARRDYGYLNTVEVPGGEEAIYRRTDEVALEAILTRPRWRDYAWLRLRGEAEWRENEGHDMSDAELRVAGWEIGDLDPTIGVSGRPGYTNIRRYPFSISPEDGVSGFVSAGRWWNARHGGVAYDELVGVGAAYLGLPIWGFADHVLAGRAAGLVREGDAAFSRSLGGVSGGVSPVLGSVFANGSSFPVRGYPVGARHGTRAWAASAEWRFPIHMVAAPGRIFGFSLTSLAGTVYGDVGDAWCTDDQREGALQHCAGPGLDPLASVGAELVIDFGLLHNESAIVRAGVAHTLTGPRRTSTYLAFGPSF